jgi:hypothetical protein
MIESTARAIRSPLCVPLFAREVASAGSYRSHSLPPPWREHAPVCCCEYDYSLSRRIAVAAP